MACFCMNKPILFLYLFSSVLRLFYGAILLTLSMFYPMYDSDYVAFLGFLLIFTSIDVVLCGKNLKKYLAVLITVFPTLVVNLLLYKRDGVFHVAVVDVILVLAFLWALYLVPTTNCATLYFHSLRK